MISALRGYCECEPTPTDAESVKATSQYLEACNLIFEKGILSKKMVRALNSSVIQNIRDGFTFFVDWFEKHQAQGKNE